VDRHRRVRRRGAARRGPVGRSRRHRAQGGGAPPGRERGALPRRSRGADRVHPAAAT
jgi:hypothetical protein